MITALALCSFGIAGMTSAQENTRPTNAWREVPPTGGAAQERTLKITGNAIGNQPGGFAMPADDGTLQANTAADDVARLTVGPSGLFRRGSSLRFAAHGTPPAGAGISISLPARRPVRNVESAMQLNAFVSFTLDTTEFDHWNAGFKNIAVSLWRENNGAPDTFQFAYDANGNGFGPEDLLGEPIRIQTQGAGQPAKLQAILSKKSLMQRDEVRLYAWSSRHGRGAPFHLYHVEVDYTTHDGRRHGSTYSVHRNFDFGEGRNHLKVIGSNPHGHGRIELRVGSPDHEPIGSIDIYHTGDWHHYIEFENALQKSVRGVHDLYVSYHDPMGKGGPLFSIRELRLERRSPGLRLPIDADEDGDGMDNLLEYATGQHPQAADGLPITITRNRDGIHAVAVRLRNDRSLDIQLRVSNNKTNWAEMEVRHHDGSWQTRTTSPLRVVNAVPDPVHKDIDTVTFVSRAPHPELHVDVVAKISNRGRLNVYPPVPELEPSPYYTFAVQKVANLNAENLADVTNWEHPFAFFTQATPFVREEGRHWDRYYNQFTGSWSQTYCNFEMDALTPIVVKISRRNHPVAPSGAITRAAAHPARKVDSVEIINGDVYVTMSHPAQVVIDIDGQMDERDAPRDWSAGRRFPYKDEATAVHAVSIFANPVIEDKPDPKEENVRFVQAGTPVPRDENGFWDTQGGKYDTLYFGPGAHKVSYDDMGNERGWRPGDIVRIASNQNIYVPGDAILYFPLTDTRNMQQVSNTRIFGHGTLSGSMMHHIKYAGIDYKPIYNHLQMLMINQGVNCRFEGLTVVDQPMHGIYIFGGRTEGDPNFIRWCKIIGWRQNSDAMQVTGNGFIEDCFLRGSDDSAYLSGRGLRRLVIWTDNFGRSLMGAVARGQSGMNCPIAITEPFLIEDIDVIYGRNQGATRGIIDLDRCRGAATFATGTKNTGQHLVFRNINYEDPRPVKTLIFLRNDRPDETGNHFAGVRFENVVQHHDHSDALKAASNPRSRIHGTKNGPLRYNVFNQVFIAGEHVDEKYLKERLQAEHTHDSIFK